MEEPCNIGSIILAAGSSSRMGQSKQLLPVNGVPLLVKTIQAVTGSSSKHNVVVLGANVQEHLNVIEHLSVQFTFNEDWVKGIGSSIKKGLRALLEKQPALDGVIITVCDQPFLSSSHFFALIDTFNTSRNCIIASGYGGTLGVPVLFPTKFFQYLHELPDNEGAKKLLQHHRLKTTVVDFPDGAIDIDTPDDYSRLSN
jgi:molybdenum cofactor cytidylyltransferase